MRMYIVGGAVRDELLGVKSKDIDFVVVLEDIPWMKSSGWYDDVTPFDRMVGALESQGYELFKDDKGKIVGSEFFTARGKFPKWHPQFPGKPADFVLARKEAGYSDGRHPDSVEPGTLEDDLNRRDFSMNAIAKDMLTGNLIDPHGGVDDIKRGLIRAVGNPRERLLEDPLRALRALRFAVTKKFDIDFNLSVALRDYTVYDGIVHKVSDERIKDELDKMFAFDTVHAIYVLTEYPRIMQAAFAGRVSLESTLKQRGKK